MRLMTDAERQLLIELSENFPALRQEMQRRLDADTRLFWETVEVVQLSQHAARQEAAMMRSSFHRWLGAVLGPVLAVAGVLVISHVDWLMNGP
jgi:hypothetical protein